MAKIAAALAIISAYIYLFGIMGTIESLESNMPEVMESEAPTEEVPESSSEADVTTTSVTTAVSETDRVIYTYETELNVLNGKKPSLVDYTATEPLMVIEDAPAAAATVTTTLADFAFDEDDFDYTTPKKTTTTAAPPVTTTTTSLTTAATQIVTVASTPVTAAFETSTTTTTTTTTTTEAAEVPAESSSATTTTTAVSYLTPKETTTTTTEEYEDDVFDLEDDEEIEETEESSVTDPSSWMDEIPDEGLETSTTTTTADSEPAEPENNAVSTEMLTVNAGGTITTDYAANIVAKAVMAEVGDSFSEEAIKAQAIATYTYIKYYNSNNQNAYVVFKTPSDKVTRCVSEVIGKALYYNGALVQSVYSASSAGYTASSLNVWGVDYPYLRSVKTEFDSIYDINYGRQSTFTSEEVKRYIEANTNITVTGDPSTWLEITSRIDGAYVGSLKICGQETFFNGTRDVNINGRVFRETIMNYNIRSASFDVLYNAQDDTFVFTTYGYGHGVGMSQHGANILATQYGYTYKEILEFYYGGTVIA